MERGREAFWRLFAPRIAADTGGRFVAVEGRVDEVAKLLDTNAGIDALFIDKLGLIHGVAVRVQFTDRSWDTFSVRCERDSGNPTEYDKRVAALKARAMVPHMTFQGYASKAGSTALSAAWVSTVHLFELLGDQEFMRTHSRRMNMQDGNSFYYALWDELRTRGASIRTWFW